VRIKLVDSSSGKVGYLNVDDLQFLQAGAVREYRPRVWGAADYHAHPMAHVGFGALSGVRGLWGVPGTDASEYATRPELYARDLPACSPDHNGGLTARIFINEDEQQYQFSSTSFWGKLSLLSSRGFRVEELLVHDSHGTPTYVGWPGFVNGAHQQYHITQIRRAYDGGLRLMSALAVTSDIAEFLLSPVPGSRRPPRPQDIDVIRAHICAMRQLASLNRAWMEIAYSPADARRIIHANKLAIVLGVEVDQLGSLGFATPAEEVAYLWSVGVRQVTPIHSIDNDLGGAAVFLDGYNTQMDLIKRSRRETDDLTGVDPVFFRIRDGGCVSGADSGRRGECVGFRLDADQQRAIQFHSDYTGTLNIPFSQAIHWDAYEATGRAAASGHKNARGLTPQGQFYLSAMMDRGGLIDISHMSDLSAEQAFRLSRARTVAAGRADCGPLFDLLRASESCFDDSYPFMASHVGFRSQMFRRVDGRGPGTTKKEFIANEMNLSDSQAEMLRRLGGVIGPFLGQPPLEASPDQAAPPFANDCAMSTKGFGMAYLLALQKMGRSGIGFASDFAFHPTVFPRFGAVDACNAKRMTASAEDEGERYPEQYRADAQRDGVLYDARSRLEERSPVPPERLHRTRPLMAYAMPGRTYDYNGDGLAHYGLVPDLLQDLRNLGVSARDFEPLFASAEDYVRMWEKAWRIAGCGSGGGRCNPPPISLDCDRVCVGLCPLSPNAGAPVAH
jgi:microsomal dipeptidase-like Zn-dependent dipeptidase